MKLWVDDVRPAPDGWVWVGSSEEAIAVLSYGDVEKMSLDHDLGGWDTTRRVVLWLCDNEALWPVDVFVHSSNPVGRVWLDGMIARYNVNASS